MPIVNNLSDVRLIVEGFEIDLSDDAYNGIAITKTISDVKDFTSVKGDYSYSILVPATANNNKAFSFAFKPNSQGNYIPHSATTTEVTQSGANIGINFNYKKLARAVVTENFAPILKGYIKLNRTVGNFTTGFYYELQITSELGSLVSSMGNKLIENISVPQTASFTHVNSIEVITGSWNYHPLSSSMKPVYGLIDYGDNDTIQGSNFYISTLRPGIYLRDYMNLIFADNGYTFSSSFLNSDFGKRLVVPYKDGLLLGSAFASSVTTGMSGSVMTQSMSVNSGTPTGSYYFNKIVQDNNLLYDVINEKFTAPSTGLYTVNTKIDYTLIYTSGVSYFYLINGAQSLQVNYNIYNADTSLSSTTTKLVTIPQGTYAMLSATSGSQAIFPNVTTTFPTANLRMSQGQYLKINITALNNNIDAGVLRKGIIPYQAQLGTCTFILTPAIDVDGTSLPITTITLPTNLDNSTLNFNNFCLKDTKQVDFVSSVFKTFNLICEQDPDVPKHLNLFTFDEFYLQSGSIKVKDWTAKLDRNSDMQITPIPNLNSSQLHIAFAENEDYYSKTYSQLYGGNFGERYINTGYEFSNGTMEVLNGNIFGSTNCVQYNTNPIQCESPIEIQIGSLNTIYTAKYSASTADPNSDLPSGNGFSHARINNFISYWGKVYQINGIINNNAFTVSGTLSRTPGAEDTGSGFYAKNDTFTYLQNVNDKIIPVLYESSDQNITHVPAKTNARLLYFSDIVSCSNYTLQYTPIKNGKTYIYNNSNTSNAGAQILNKYPIINFLDSLTNPTSSLLFDIPSSIDFSLGVQYPSQNLYTRFMKNGINQLIDNNCKLLTGMFNLNFLDVSNARMNDVIVVDNMQYRINAINNYQPGNILTEVELLSKPYQEYDNLALFTADNYTQPLTYITSSQNIYASASIESMRVNGFATNYISGNAFPFVQGSALDNYSQTTWQGSQSLSISVFSFKSGSDTLFVTDDYSTTTIPIDFTNFKEIVLTKSFNSGSLVYVFMSGSNVDNTHYSTIRIHNFTYDGINSITTNGVPTTYDFGEDLPLLSSSFPYGVRLQVTGSTSTQVYNISHSGAEFTYLAVTDHVNPPITASISGSGDYSFAVNTDGDSDVIFMNSTGSALPTGSWTIINDTPGSIHAVENIAGWGAVFAATGPFSVNSHSFSAPFTAVIAVDFGTAAGASSHLFLKRNGTLLQSIPITPESTLSKTFTSQTFNINDNIEILWDTDF